MNWLGKGYQKFNQPEKPYELYTQLRKYAGATIRAFAGLLVVLSTALSHYQPLKPIGKEIAKTPPSKIENLVENSCTNNIISNEPIQEDNNQLSALF